jgi:hypothetical protein
LYGVPIDEASIWVERDVSLLRASNSQTADREFEEALGGEAPESADQADGRSCAGAECESAPERLRGSWVVAEFAEVKQFRKAHEEQGRPRFRAVVLLQPRDFTPSNVTLLAVTIFGLAIDIGGRIEGLRVLKVIPSKTFF